MREEGINYFWSYAQKSFIQRIAQLKTFVSTLARRSIIGLKTATFTLLCIFRPRICFAGSFGRIYDFSTEQQRIKKGFLLSLRLCLGYVCVLRFVSRLA
jgi:hypothetical protein